MPIKSTPSRSPVKVPALTAAVLLRGTGLDQVGKDRESHIPTHCDARLASVVMAKDIASW
jgi:hypothetical protein